MEIEILKLLARLRDVCIHYRLRQARDDAIMVEVSVPGERWEIEFMDDGTMEIEVYRSNGEIRDESALEELFRRFSD